MENIDSDSSDNYSFNTLHNRRKKKKKKDFLLNQQGYINKMLFFGQFSNALQKLKTLIARYPKDPDIYFSVGMLYQEMGDKKKAADAYSISADLSPSDPQKCKKWQKIGDLYLDAESYAQASHSYSRAHKLQKSNIQLIKKRINAYQLALKIKKAIIMYKMLIQLDPQDISSIKACAKLMFKRKQYQKARQILEKIQKPCNNIINMISQTYIVQKLFQQCYIYLSNHFNDSSLKNIPIQLLIIYIQCQIQIKNIKFKDSLNIIINRYNQKYKQNYFKLAQCLAQNQFYQQSLMVYSLILINQTSHQNPLLYVNMSQNYIKLNYNQDAKSILQQGLQLFAQNNVIKQQLAYIYSQRGFIEEAIQLAKNQEQLYKEQVYLSDAQYNQKTYFTFHKKSKNLKRNRSNFFYFPSKKKLKKDLNQYKILKVCEKKEFNNLSICFFDQILEIIESMKNNQLKNNQFEQAIKMISVWINSLEKSFVKKLEVALKVSRISFFKRQIHQNYQIYQAGLKSALILRNYKHAFHLCKLVLKYKPNDFSYILLINLIMRKINNFNFYRTFVSKLTQKAKKNSNYYYLTAIQYLQSGYFQLSINSLQKIQNQNFQNPLIYLIMAVCYLQLTSSRTTLNKHITAIKSSQKFLQYKSIRFNYQNQLQVLYNLGRFYASLSFISRAIYFFQIVIKKCHQRQINMFETELKNKSIYNLMVLHKHLGNFEIMQQLRIKYMSIY